MTSARLRFAAALAVALTLGGGRCLSATPIEGDWMQDPETRVRILPCPDAPDRYCGTIVWLKDAIDVDGKPYRDRFNPNPALRTRPVIGLMFLRGFRPDGQARWSGGTAYDPDSGRTYDARASLKPNGTLKVEGCVLMICRGEIWRRP